MACRRQPQIPIDQPPGYQSRRARKEQLDVGIAYTFVSSHASATVSAGPRGLRRSAFHGCIISWRMVACYQMPVSPWTRLKPLSAQRLTIQSDPTILRQSHRCLPRTTIEQKDRSCRRLESGDAEANAYAQDWDHLYDTAAAMAADIVLRCCTNASPAPSPVASGSDTASQLSEGCCGSDAPW